MTPGHVLISERYTGTVMCRCDGLVEVLYETATGPIIQKYEPDQFIGDMPPLAAVVEVSAVMRVKGEPTNRPAGVEMFERFVGRVEHSHPKGIAVVYWIKGGPVEHRYEPAQFVGAMPPKGTEVETVLALRQTRAGTGA
jgi:hypothetical protein